MKKSFTLISSMLLTASLFAQSTTIKRDTTVVHDSNPHRVITNSFWSNWFIGIAGGAGIYFGDHDKQMKFGDRIAPNFDINIGKAFTPSISVRAGVSRFDVNGLTQHGALAYSTGKDYDKLPQQGYWLQGQKFQIYNIHGEAMFNIVNSIGGYNPKRFYSISPYVGVGWSTVGKEPKQEEVSLGIGLYNAFRLSKSLDLTFDVKGTMTNDRLDGEIGNRNQDGNLSALLGLTFKLPRQTWDRPSTTIIKYDEAELLALRDRLNQLANDNDALKKQLAEAKSSTITNVEIKKQMLAAPILVTFPINKSTVSNEARVNLGFFAKVIKEAREDIVYKITGYADKGTGSVATNERLSRERADAIYNVLVNEFGVPANQIEKRHDGGVDNMYYDDPRLSRSVITIADILTKN